MKNDNKHFCQCGNPIEEDEDYCLDCYIHSQDKYKYLAEESYTWFLTEELKEKYFKSR